MVCNFLYCFQKINFPSFQMTVSNALSKRQSQTNLLYSQVFAVVSTRIPNGLEKYQVCINQFIVHGISGFGRFGLRWCAVGPRPGIFLSFTILAITIFHPCQFHNLSLVCTLQVSFQAPNHMSHWANPSSSKPYAIISSPFCASYTIFITFIVNHCICLFLQYFDYWWHLREMWTDNDHKPVLISFYQFTFNQQEMIDMSFIIGGPADGLWNLKMHQHLFRF